MKATFPDTLLQLFHQVIDNPDDLPAVPVDDWQGDSVEWQLLSSFRDMLERIQQRKQDTSQAEQQIREKEAQYRGIFEASVDGIFIADLDGVPVEANPATCQIFGYTYEEFIGLHPIPVTWDCTRCARASCALVGHSRSRAPQDRGRVSAFGCQLLLNSERSVQAVEQTEFAIPTPENNLEEIAAGTERFHTPAASSSSFLSLSAASAMLGVESESKYQFRPA